MNYCTAEDVQVLVGSPDAFNSNSTPTLAQVNSIIADITNEIDFTLKSVGISVQPTDATLLGRLTLACKYGVACQVAMSGYGNTGSVEGSQGDKYCEKYKEVLDDIKENPELYGVVTGDSAMYASNRVVDGSITEAELKDKYIDDNFKY